MPIHKCIIVRTLTSVDSLVRIESGPDDVTQITCDAQAPWKTDAMICYPWLLARLNEMPTNFTRMIGDR